MTILRPLLLALALCATLSSAFAAPKAREVEEQMRAKNWTQAEQMLQEVLEEKPNSAKAWYLLAQTQEQQRNLGSALSSLKKASELDSSLAFASPGAADKMRRRLERATGASRTIAPRVEEPAIASMSPQEPKAQRDAPRPERQTAERSMTPTPILAAQPDRSRSASKAESGSGFGGAFLVFLTLAGLCAGGYFIYRKLDARKAAAQRDTDRKALLARALSVQTRAAELLKTARFEAPETAFMSLASSIASSADSALGRLKASAASSFSASEEERKLRELEARVERAEAKAARKSWDEDPAPTPPAPAARAPSVVESFNGSASSSRDEERESYRSAPRHSRSDAPTTVVVQQPDPFGGLMGAMALNELLNGSSSRERDLERQLERERDRNDRRDSAPAYEPPAPSYEDSYEAPELDFGRSSSSDSDDGWDSSPPIDTRNKDEF